MNVVRNAISCYLLFLSLPCRNTRIYAFSSLGSTIHRRPASDHLAGNAIVPPNYASSEKYTSTQLNGIRGFRSWFESQFPNAMNTIDHSRRNKLSASDTFDHVLIDMNQLLHITLRRSRTEGHALTLLIQELDKCMDIALPTKSIVLAFDGPAAAAKLATQRRRRYSTVVRAERKKARKELLQKRGIFVADDNYDNSSSPSSSKKRRRKKNKDRAEKEEETLKITPGTEFMDRAHEAILYWAWQRLENPRGRLSKCRIYISPSTVPGEGEVKLLDWLIQAGEHQRPTNHRTRTFQDGINQTRGRIVKAGESVAILGGDSDLVLEGLVIPPSITHNVFVILPSGFGTSYVVSLWETTLALGRFLAPHFDPKECMYVRTDLVLLLIMNGNDYLPKLRGSAGFNKLFHTYLRLLKKWLKEEKGAGPRRPYLIDPDTLEFNLPFCIAFFEELASVAPKNLAQPSEMIPFHKSITPLSHLHSMVDGGFLPRPAVFTRSTPLKASQDKEILRLTLGENETDSQIQFEIEHRISSTPLKKTKQILANMALEELLGKDYKDMDDYIGGGGSDGDDVDSSGDDTDDDFGLGPISGAGYSWEISLPAASSVDEYLKGLIWNLSTYQDGVCSDYGYNYGRRMSPTAEEVVSYLKDAQENRKSVSRSELLNGEIGSPLNAGLSCLAALPSQVDYLIPEPFQKLSKNGSIEEIYEKCMDPENNVFDMKLFQNLCMDQLGSIKIEKKPLPKYKDFGRRSRGRKVRLGDTFWTILRRTHNPLVHPFDPPLPYSSRLSYLRFDPRIKSSHMIASDKPRWLTSDKPRLQKSRGVSRNQLLARSVDSTVATVRHSGMGNLLTNTVGDDTRLEDVGYKMVYQSGNDDRNGFEKQKMARTKEERKDDQFTLQLEISRMKKFGINVPSQKMAYNTERFNAITCLQQLCDADLLQSLEWSYHSPSNSEYASSNPSLYEIVVLSIKIGDTEKEFKLDRNMMTFSRKAIKHSLATDVMNEIFEGRDWKQMKMIEMKSFLAPKNQSNENNGTAGKNALQCIHQLSDARCFDVSWEYLPSSQTENTETVRLTINGDEQMNLVLEESRNVYEQSKSSMKHRLAILAMDQIMQESGKSWKSMTIAELKGHF